MKQILIAECKQEVSSFNPVASGYASFDVAWGTAVPARHRGVWSEVAGALEVFEAHDVELLPAYSAVQRTSGGLLAAAGWSRLSGEFLGSLRAAPPVDGVYFALHGAMSADGEDDPEGFLLAEARKILGEQIPIVASFDLHGILTDRMLDALRRDRGLPHLPARRLRFAPAGAPPGCCCESSTARCGRSPRA